MDRRTFFGIALTTVPAIAHGQSPINLKVCRVDGGDKCCRYLGQEDSGNGYDCLKLSPAHRRIIDEEVALFMQEMRPIQGVPLGNNCSGRLPLLSTLIDIT